MPSNRKRIGYLPSEEIHEIIDKISLENKISQSRVTGLLVEEALRSRGIINNLLPNITHKKNNILDIAEDKNDLTNKKGDRNFNFSHNERNIKSELNMINDYIEYKFFKKIMSANKN